MVQHLKIGKLTCSYVAIKSQHICYILVPVELDEAAITEWAKQYEESLAVISGMDWDNDLTPWPAPGVMPHDKPFKGQAGEFLGLLTSRVLPEMEQALSLTDTVERTLVGISLSGMFALWAWLQGDKFTHIGSISGSFWYDDFTEWLGHQTFDSKKGCAYFSLGDKEGKEGNKRFNTVQTNTLQVVERLRKAGIKATFEATVGTHFAPIGPRMERLFQGLKQLSNDEL